MTDVRLMCGRSGSPAARPLAVAALMLAACGLVTPRAHGQETELVVVPAVAYGLPGFDTNLWTSEIYFSNPTPVRADATFEAILPGSTTPPDTWSSCPWTGPWTLHVNPESSERYAMGSDLCGAEEAVGAFLEASAAEAFWLTLEPHHLERALRKLFDWRDLQISTVRTTLLDEEQGEVLTLTEQIAPKFLIVADGHLYKGVVHSSEAKLRGVLAGLPEVERGDLMSAYYRRLTSEDPAVRRDAARAWSIWEGTTSKLRVDPDAIARFGSEEFADAFARIEAHYFVHGAWLKTDTQLLDDAARIAGIPGVIVQGRYDVVCPAASAWASSAVNASSSRPISRRTSRASTRSGSSTSSTSGSSGRTAATSSRS